MKILEAFAQTSNHILSHDEIASIMGLNTHFYDPSAGKIHQPLAWKNQGHVWYERDSEHPRLRLSPDAGSDIDCLTLGQPSLCIITKDRHMQPYRSSCTSHLIIIKPLNEHGYTEP
jgi:hypothetical protein